MNLRRGSHHLPPFIGKVVLITGSSSGIGAVTAVHFAKLGASVVVTGRDPFRTRAVARQCRVMAVDDAKIIDVIADLTSECNIRMLLRTTIDYFGRLDVLINNANVSGITPLDDTCLSMQCFDKMMLINVRAPYLLSQLAKPFLTKTRGSIINVSSRAGTNPFQDYSVYCMTKSALDMMTKCLAVDLRSQGIRVNSVNPAAIKPKVFGRIGLTEEQIRHGQDLHYPLGRLGEPEEIARTIEFLASHKAAHISGVSTSIDGGALYAPHALATVGDDE